MAVPHNKQSVQDWFTQQWVILFGRKINQKEHNWLVGPFGGSKGIGLQFIYELAERESLTIDKTQKKKGLIQSIAQLEFAEDEVNTLSNQVIDFYENTSNYGFCLQVNWNPLFKGLGRLLNLLFSKRIQQLNIPIENIRDSKSLNSEIIHLRDAKTGALKHTIWLRTIVSTDQVVYSGVYKTCKLPSGQACIKAVFPLPYGNATVFLTPSVGKNGELMLQSSGKRFGDSGFYFLLNDSKGQLWSKFVKSFQDALIVRSHNNQLTAQQKLTLWGLRVLTFEYEINKIS